MWTHHIQITVAAQETLHCMWLSIIQLTEDLQCGAIGVVVLLHAMVSNLSLCIPLITVIVLNIDSLERLGPSEFKRYCQTKDGLFNISLSQGYSSINVKCFYLIQ